MFSTVVLCTIYSRFFSVCVCVCPPRGFQILMAYGIMNLKMPLMSISLPLINDQLPFGGDIIC